MATYSAPQRWRQSTSKRSTHQLRRHSDDQHRLTDGKEKEVELAAEEEDRRTAARQALAPLVRPHLPGSGTLLFSPHGSEHGAAETDDGL